MKKEEIEILALAKMLKIEADHIMNIALEAKEAAYAFEKIASDLIAQRTLKTRIVRSCLQRKKGRVK